MKKKKIDEYFVKVYAAYCNTYAAPTRKKLLEIAPAVYKSKLIVTLLSVWNNARMKYELAAFDEIGARIAAPSETTTPVPAEICAALDECEYILDIVLADKLKDAAEHGPEK